MNENSTPPQTFCLLGFLNCSGSTPPLMPRYTLHAGVSLPSLMIAELIVCSVVV